MFRERIGYGSRVKNSVVGFLFGIVLCLGAVVLMVWNERDAVRQTGAITEIEKVAIADVPSENVDASQDGKLVHMNATAITDDVLSYPEFGIRENAIRLRWDSSIYQWEEDRRKTDDEVRYSYAQNWVDRPIDSSSFRHPEGHSNHGSKQQFRDGSAQAKDVRFGAFRLTDRLIQQINEEQPYAGHIPTGEELPTNGAFHGNVFYTGDPNAPKIGDERVELFMVGPSHAATVMARQSGESFGPYETKVGVNKEILYVGTLSKPEVIGRQRTEAAMKRWLLRGAGFLCVWIGSSLLLKPIRAVLSFVPFLGRILDGAIGIVGFLIAAIVSTVVIAVAWFAVRPILSLVLLAIGIAAFVVMYRQKSAAGPNGHGSGGNRPPSPPPTPSSPPPLPS